MINAPVLHVNGDYPEGERVPAFACKHRCLITNQTSPRPWTSRLGIEITSERISLWICWFIDAGEPVVHADIVACI
jgi:hypothetical protein